MARKSIDKETRQAIRDSKSLIEHIMRLDGNEAETRRRVERIFENLLGYDSLRHLSRERAVKGAGETEHVDFTVQLEEGADAKPIIMVELKRVGVDLALKHLKQVSSYAIDTGCEWILLTNGREWKLYHVEFGQPPITTCLDEWNLLTDDTADLAAKFQLISYKSVRKGELDDLWRRTKVLEPKSLLASILSEPSLLFLRRNLRKATGVVTEFEEIIQGVRRLLNEAAAIEMEALRIRIPQRKQTNAKSRRIEETDGEPEAIENEELSEAVLEESVS